MLVGTKGFNGKINYQWWILYCHVRLAEGIAGKKGMLLSFWDMLDMFNHWKWWFHGIRWWNVMGGMTDWNQNIGDTCKGVMVSPPIHKNRFLLPVNCGIPFVIAGWPWWPSTMCFRHRPGRISRIRVCLLGPSHDVWNAHETPRKLG